MEEDRRHDQAEAAYDSAGRRARHISLLEAGAPVVLKVGIPWTYLEFLSKPKR